MWVDITVNHLITHIRIVFMKTVMKCLIGIKLNLYVGWWNRDIPGELLNIVVADVAVINMQDDANLSSTSKTFTTWAI